MIISIRPAQASDAVRWEEIHASGWEYAYRGILDDNYLDATKEKFRTNISKTKEFLSDKNGIKLVAINENGVIVGTMGGIVSLSEKGEKIFDLQGLYLDPKYIGLGIGRKLVNAFADWVKQNGGQKFIIGCLEQNKSCGFYKKLGGTEFERRMFKDKYPEIIFQFVLDKNGIINNPKGR